MYSNIMYMSVTFPFSTFSWYSMPFFWLCWDVVQLPGKMEHLASHSHNHTHSVAVEHQVCLPSWSRGSADRERRKDGKWLSFKNTLCQDASLTVRLMLTHSEQSHGLLTRGCVLPPLYSHFLACFKETHPLCFVGQDTHTKKERARGRGVCSSVTNWM